VNEERRVAAVIETLRPAIQGDGGDVELVAVNDKGLVQVRPNDFSPWGYICSFGASDCIRA
jgi:hypothetical protein